MFGSGKLIIQPNHMNISLSAAARGTTLKASTCRGPLHQPPEPQVRRYHFSGVCRQHARSESRFLIPAFLFFPPAARRIFKKNFEGEYMKTHKHLYPQVYDFENLYLAYRKARRAAPVGHSPPCSKECRRMSCWLCKVNYKTLLISRASITAFISMTPRSA